MKREPLIVRQVKAIIDHDAPIISNLANVSRILYDHIHDVSWSGFYLYDVNLHKLCLGPYQGSLACTTIDMNNGVCGKSAYMKKTLVVDNVHEFPGHIACSNLTNSEIVVPIIKNDVVYGVIDLDSNEFSNFKEEDKNVIELIAEVVSNLFL